MVKEKKRFGDIFSESWKEFKEGWKVFLVIMVFLSFIPSLIINVFVYFFQPDALKLIENADTSKVMPILIQFFIPFIIIWIIVFILGVWMNSSFIYNSMYKKKYMGIKETLMGGKKYFWKLLGFTLLLILILGVPLIFIDALGIYLNYLGVSLIIIIIYWFIFLIYFIFLIWIVICWIFSAYILIGENKGIIDSLKLSKKLTKGKWWKTFGYFFLFILIIAGISIIVALITLSINFTINPNYFNDLFSKTPKLSNELVSLFFGYIMNIFFVPLSVYFMKNLYLAWKSEEKK